MLSDMLGLKNQQNCNNTSIYVTATKLSFIGNFLLKYERFIEIVESLIIKKHS